MLNKYQINQRNLTTTSLILFSMLKTLIKQNKDLKEQRHTFEMIHLNWTRVLNEKQVSFNIKKMNGTKMCSKKSTENYVLADAVDYSVSSSMLSGSSESLTDSVLSVCLNKGKKKPKIKICGLFRKISILIMATNRLIYLYSTNKNNRLYLFDSNICHQFIHFNNENNDNCDSFSTVLSSVNFKVNKLNFIEENKLKALLSWLTLTNDNKQLNQLNQISNELNRYLFNEEICK